MTPEERQDEWADRHAEVAAQLVARIREDNPADVGRWLHAAMGGLSWDALARILAAAVPDDRSWLDLTAWTRQSSPQTPATAAQRLREWADAAGDRSRRVAA